VTTFGCEKLEISEQFAIMTNPNIVPKYRTVGSLIVVINYKLEDVHPFWQAGCMRGNPCLQDPLKQEVSWMR
jgi:hypothetical protein